jgi:hypothetical protein
MQVTIHSSIYMLMVVYHKIDSGHLLFIYASIRLSTKQPIYLPRLGCTYLARLCPGV